MIIEFIQKIRRILYLALAAIILLIVVLSAALVLILTALFDAVNRDEPQEVNIQYEIHEKNTKTSSPSAN